MLVEIGPPNPSALICRHVPLAQLAGHVDTTGSAIVREIFF
jgi:hypothetical protein